MSARQADYEGIAQGRRKVAISMITIDRKTAIVGYGKTFNMGYYHCEQITQTKGLELVGYLRH